MQRISFTHILFLAAASLCAIILNWSALQASTSLYNLIVVVPSGALVVGISLYIIINAFTQKKDNTKADADTSKESKSSLAGDVVFLLLFGLFCFNLTRIGFDLATFLFVWLGILLGGEKNWFIPPIFSALFTLFLIKGFGALFPFPMPLMVF